ncbi:MAG: ribosomal RNA small subunit methyltransferase A [Crocinitomicaceae bacterium]|nr:ribosomal RNA small subunit methyltransferase A [Crocinitomicaceae bacterium]
MVAKSNGVKAKKHLGQHFLEDPSVAERIAGSILTDHPDACILEIGPGTGALTRPLIQRFGSQVLALDVDSESAAFLKQQDWIPEGSVQRGDFLHMGLSDLGDLRPIVVAGNFPYNISSQILFKFLEWKDRGTELVGMFQKEVAERVCAGHGSKTYGILSVLIQVYYEAEYLFTVPPHVFNPPPKVHSGVLRLRRRPEWPEDVTYADLKRLTKAAFNQRRKTLRNSLRAGGFAIDGIDEATLKLRPEQLSPEAFVDLTRQLTAQ